MKFTLKHSEKAEKLVSSMSVNQLIDQCVCPHFGVNTVATANEYGSIFIHAGEKAKLKEVIKNYKAKCKIPPLIAGDFESGPCGMLSDGIKFPSQMGVSQTNSTELIYEIGKLTAKEVLAVGYNWNFSRCVDISAISHNPIVLNRSYGETAEQVIKMATAYMNGMQDVGLITSAKHFPGDSYDVYDQHLTTTINSLSMAEWYEKSGKCFKALIDNGVKAIMPGHISLPAYDTPDEKLGICPPATLSYPLMTRLLKNELGFNGIIVSDAINMNGAV
jgi:beta-N-acetylhexosaminidase